MVFYYCDIKHNRDFKPDYDTFYGRNIPPNMKRASCMYNKSVSGLICTNMEEAVKRLNKINNGKYLGALKEGDKLYVVCGDSEKKIKIFDGEEVGKKKRSWSDEKHDGIHMLEPANILLVRLGKQ